MATLGTRRRKGQRLSWLGTWLMLTLASIGFWLSRLEQLTGARLQGDPDRCAQASPNHSGTSPYISSEQLSQLTQHYGASQVAVQDLLGIPRCLLPSIAIRANVLTDRAIYLLEDGTALIVAYEEGGYVGHSLERDPMPQEFTVQQSWDLEPGDFIGEYPIVASLGDLSLQIKGSILAPDSGYVADQALWRVGNSLESLTEDCALFTSPKLPTYLSKICGLKQINDGEIRMGEVMGQTNALIHFSLLTLRPNQDSQWQWRYVAPSPDFLKQFLP